MPVLVVGVKLHSVIVDILNERKEIKCEGVESDYVGYIDVLKD